jgi:hypothetical protein
MILRKDRNIAYNSINAKGLTETSEKRGSLVYFSGHYLALKSGFLPHFCYFCKVEKKGMTLPGRGDLIVGVTAKTK